MSITGAGLQVSYSNSYSASVIHGVGLVIVVGGAAATITAEYCVDTCPLLLPFFPDGLMSEKKAPHPNEESQTPKSSNLLQH
jgi:hypothetical protein